MEACTLFALLFLVTACGVKAGNSQTKADSLMPAVRGFCIALPSPSTLDEFIGFTNDELAPRQVNTLVLRVEYKYRFRSHPELIDTIDLSKKEIKRIVRTCRENNIQVIPLIDMLGHSRGGGTPESC